MNGGLKPTTAAFGVNNQEVPKLRRWYCTSIERKKKWCKDESEKKDGICPSPLNLISLTYSVLPQHLQHHLQRQATISDRFAFCRLRPPLEQKYPSSSSSSILILPYQLTILIPSNPTATTTTTIHNHLPHPQPLYLLANRVVWGPLPALLKTRNSSLPSRR